MILKAKNGNTPHGTHLFDFKLIREAGFYLTNLEWEKWLPVKISNHPSAFTVRPCVLLVWSLARDLYANTCIHT